MAYEDLIPIVAVIAAVSIPFIMRGLDFGHKSTTTTTNVYNLSTKHEALEKEVEEGFKQFFDKNDCLGKELRQGMKEIYDRIGQLASAINLHTEQIKRVERDAEKLDEKNESLRADVSRRINELESSRLAQRGGGSGGGGGYRQHNRDSENIHFDDQTSRDSQNR